MRFLIDTTPPAETRAPDYSHVVAWAERAVGRLALVACLAGPAWVAWAHLSALL